MWLDIITSSNVSSGNSGAKNVSGCWSIVVVSVKKLCKFPISDISGNVIALVPNGIIGWCLKLLLSVKLGLLSKGTLASGPLKIGGEVPTNFKVITSIIDYHYKK